MHRVRDDMRDVYEGEVAKVDSVSELVRRVDGVVDGLRSLVGVARGSVGGVCGDVFEEVEERFAHPPHVSLFITKVSIPSCFRK